MAYLSATDRARIEAQIVTKTAQLDAANTALTAALANVEISSYKFESGEGSQSASRRKPAEIQESIRQLENQIDRLYNRLSGTGIVNMNLRRSR